MLVSTQFRFNSSINRIIERVPFDIIYRYKPEMRMNIVSAMEGNSLLEETPAARQEVELRKKDKKTLKKLWEKV